jgi:hypothetical protein
MTAKCRSRGSPPRGPLAGEQCRSMSMRGRSRISIGRKRRVEQDDLLSPASDGIREPCGLSYARNGRRLSAPESRTAGSLAWTAFL